MAPAIRPALQLLAAERGGDRGDGVLAEGQRQRAVGEDVGQVLGGLLGEAAGDLGVAAERLVHLGRGDDLAVQGRSRTGSAADCCGDSFAGDRLELLGALVGELHRTIQTAALLVELRLGVVDVRAGDLGRAEDVLGVALGAARDRRGRCGLTPSPAARAGLLVGAVQRRELLLQRRGGRVRRPGGAAGSSGPAAPEVLALGVGVASFFRASVTARPWVVALAEGVAFGPDAVSGSLAFALGVALGVRRTRSRTGCAEPSAGRAAPPATVSTGRK